MSPAELLQKASAVTRPCETQPRKMKKWLPVIVELRGKDWHFSQIYKFLKDNGEAVQENERTFIASASRAYNRHIEQIIKNKH